ncbi:hypothetical protein [Archaeoglobus sp.]
MSNVRNSYTTKYTQPTFSTYDTIESFDDLDWKIIIQMADQQHLSAIARTLGVSKLKIWYRVKKILQTGLVKEVQYRNKKYYRVYHEILNLACNKINGMDLVNNNNKNKILGRVEGAQPNRPNQPKQPPVTLSDVHHVTATVKVRPLNTSAVRLACQNCPKFREGVNCKCKKGRYIRMNNWDFHAIRYRTYEITAHNGKEITVSVRGIRVLIDWTSSEKPSDQVYYKAKDIARSLIDDYFNKRFPYDVEIDWDNSFRVKGVHLVLEENEERVKNIQNECKSQTVTKKGDAADVVVDESPDDDGNPQPHVEAHIKDLRVLDYYSDLLNGRIHKELANLRAIAMAGLSVQNFEDMVRSLEQNLESRLNRLEEDIREIKSLILEQNREYIRESNATLQSIATAWVRIGELESETRKIRSFLEKENRRR